MSAHQEDVKAPAGGPVLLSAARSASASGSSAGDPSDKEAGLVDARELVAGALGGNTAEAQRLRAELVLEPAEERRLLRRIDFYLLPYASVLYLLSFLDRTNIGQAAIKSGTAPNSPMSSSLRTSLNIVKGNMYPLSLSLFFAAYILVEVPSQNLLKWLGPRKLIPITMILWGLVCTLMGVVTTAEGLVAARWFLGMFEGALFPALNLINSWWYPRDVIGLRSSILFSGATLAGAFGGLLAYALKHIDIKSGPFAHESWRWIFIVEGLLTLVAVIPGYWLLVDEPQNEKRILTQQEAAQWTYRLATSQGAVGADAGFTWCQVRRAFTNWRTWCMAIMYNGVATPLYSLALFSPQIIQGLHVGGTVSANLMSVPPYAFGFLVSIASAFASDRVFLRTPFIAAYMLVVVIGYAILLTDVAVGVKYFALFLCVGGVSPSIPVAISFMLNNTGPSYKRATQSGIFFVLGNGAGLISSNIYPTTEAPRYIKGHSISLAFALLAVVCAVILGFDAHLQNKRRDAKFGKPPADGSDTDPLRADDPELKKKYGLENMSRQEVLLLGESHPAFRFVV